MGGSQRRAVESYLRQLVIHAGKMEFHPATEARPHWRMEIDNFRASLAAELRDSPSLRARRQELYDAAWRRAQRDLLGQLAEEHPERAKAVAIRFGPDGPRYDLDTQLLNEDWYPARIEL